ncbi:MFS transporter [Pusillimonas sp.]|uniref:MFS transporter n=1 Tax=Pusillimonas sp. TaxID=3040095 RepID=UPI0037C8912E
MTSGNSSFSMRGIAVAAFGPSLLFGVGEGAIFPVIALSAKDLGASLAMSGFIVSLFGIGALLNNIPAALIAARYGERRSMIGAAMLTVLALVLCLAATTTWMLGLGVLIIGMASSVFLLARQTFLIEAVPLAMRARALSTLGGVMRVGLFIGPFAGAACMHFIDLPGAYWAAIAAMAGAGLLSFTVPELEHAKQRKNEPGFVTPRMGGILKAHASSFLTLGLASAFVAATRSCRQIIVPLWASHIGLDAPTTALVYGFMGSIDMLLFYPAGKIMDRYGRQWIALPSMVLMGVALVLMPLTTGLAAFVAVCMLMGLGNGISSGLNMTVGADASPPVGRTQFLGIWRLITDCGAGGGPLLLSGIMAVLSLGAGIVAVGSMGFIAAALFWRWLPRRVEP